MEVAKIRELVEKARMSVEGLEEPVKTETYKIVLERLLEMEIKRGPRNTIQLSEISGNIDNDHELQKICSVLNRTDYPALSKMKGALDKSLYILLMSRDDVGVDGLLSLQISKILKTVFRESVSSAAIGMALRKATDYVDSKPIKKRGGDAYKYLIMRKGEERLANIFGGAA